jgi:hypothetical protein
MSAKLKPAPRRPVDDWEEFRPVEVSQRRSSHSAAPKLLIASLLFTVLVLIWVYFKPSIGGTVAQIGRVVDELGHRNMASNRSRTPVAAVVRRTPRTFSATRGESPRDAARVPGPFEVYLLDGNRYIHVDSRNKSVLLNMKTGETTWRDTTAPSQRGK